MIRAGYHHGDLRRALLESAMQLARGGGRDAVVLRDAARRAAVSPNAVYRHFASRDDLLAAVAGQAQEAMAERMLGFESSTPTTGSVARDRLRAVGLGYIAFALDEPGWFDAAFSEITAQPGTAAPPPLALLVEALDGLVAAGELSPDARAGAEWPCWSTVHGFAVLALHGPLRAHPRSEVWASAERAVDAVVDGVLLRRRPGDGRRGAARGDSDDPALPD